MGMLERRLLPWSGTCVREHPLRLCGRVTLATTH